MHVDDPVGEARHEAGVEDRHVAGQHDELDALGQQPVGDGAVALRARAVLRAQEHPRRDARRRRAVEGTRRGLIAGDRDDLDLPAVELVEQRLEVGALARGEDAHPHAASPTRSFG